MNSGNLKQLISSCGNLTEPILKTIALSLLSALETFHKNSNKAYGTIFPSQILFNDDGTIKVKNTIFHIILITYF